MGKQGTGREIVEPHLLELPHISYLLHVIGRSGVHLALGSTQTAICSWRLKLSRWKMLIQSSGLETEPPWEPRAVTAQVFWSGDL